MGFLLNTPFIDTYTKSACVHNLIRQKMSITCEEPFTKTIMDMKQQSWEFRSKNFEMKDIRVHNKYL
jgi:hypothetical protein